MFKKILVIIGIIILFAIMSAYFVYADKLATEGEKKMVCKDIKVVILDSLSTRFVKKDEVLDMIEKNCPVIGINISEINTFNIEKLLNTKSAISNSQAYVKLPDLLVVEVTQRKPVIRIQNYDCGYYVDNSGYIFGLLDSFSSYVPIITGNIPLEFERNFRGYPVDEDKKWIESALNLVRYIENDTFWSKQIEQIYIEKNGDIILSPKIGEQKIIFGNFYDIDEKFKKLSAFYNSIIPEVGWKRYSSVNIKYKNQIICK